MQLTLCVCIPQLTPLSQLYSMDGECYHSLWCLTNQHEKKQKPPDTTAAESKELWSNIHCSWKPTPCLHPKSTVKGHRLHTLLRKWLHVPFPSLPCFRCDSKEPMRKLRGFRQQFPQVVQKLHKKKNILKGTWTNPDRKVQWKLKTKRRDYNDWDPFFTVNKGCIGTWTEFASTNLAMKEFKTSLARISDQY